MKRLFQFLAIMIFYGLSLAGCHKDSALLPTETEYQYQSITIEDAIAAYKKVPNNLYSSARKANDGNVKKIRFVTWSKAKKVKIKNGEFIQVPLVLNSPWSLADQGGRRLIFFKKNGKTSGMIVQVVADKDYLKRSNNKFDTKFTGTTTFYDLDDSFLGGFNYNAGVLNGYVTEIDGEIGKWFIKQSNKNGRVAGDVTCWSSNNCTTITKTDWVYNPCGNNICGGTWTSQRQTITTRYCNYQLTCAGWDNYGFPYGDPTCMWQLDCSQTLEWTPAVEEPESTPLTEFLTAHSDWFSPEEQQWIMLESAQDPSFVDDYRYWGEIARDQAVNDGPLTSSDLINWAKAKGICAGIDEVRCNRRAGKAFERAALRYLGMSANGTSYPTNVRQAQNQNYPPSVIPDGVKDLLYVSGSANVHVQGYTFVEVKAVDGTLNLSSNEYQVKGFLDALREKRNQLQQQIGRSPDSRVKPKLVFMTTSNTVIGADVIQQANNWGIRLYQMKAYRVNGTYSYTPNELTISFGPFMPLNFKNEAQTDVPIIEILRNFYNRTTGVMRSEPIMVVSDPDDGLDQDDN